MRYALAAVAVIALASYATATAAQTDHTPHNTPPPRCTLKKFKPFVKRVWRLDRWRRGDAPPATTRAAKKRIACAGPENAPAMRQAWVRAKIEFFAWRKERLAERRRHLRYLDAVDPPGLAILETIAACESGGDPTAVSPDGSYRGKYQFDYGTWESVGGSGDPAAAPEREQDERAAALYRIAGSSPWPVCGV